MVTFFPSNPAQSAAAQAIYGGQAAVDVARIRAEETKAIAQAQMRQQQQLAEQERFWRAQQQQQQDALAREQLKSTDFFNRGRLTNEEKQIAATLEANKSRDAMTAAWHQAQLAPQAAKLADAKAADAQDAAMLGAQLENLAKVRTEYDRLTADLSKLSALETAQAEQMKLPQAPGTTSRFFRGGGFAPNVISGARMFGFDPLGAEKTTGFRSEPTRADGTKIGDINFSGARGRLESQLKQLEGIIKSNQELTSLLAKAPDGSWVPALPTTAMTTNAPARTPFFSTPAPAAVVPSAITNTPAIVPAAPMTNMPVVAPPTNGVNRFVYVPGQGLVPR